MEIKEILKGIVPKYNINDEVYIIESEWDFETAEYIYKASTKKSLIKEVNIRIIDDYIMQKKDICIQVEYGFKYFDKDYLSTNSKFESCVYKTYEEAERRAKKLNNK